MIKHRSFRSPILLLAVVLLAPFLPVLLAPAGRVLGNSSCDNPSMFYFINEFAGQCWRHGIVPLWNPYIMLGHPFLGEGQAAVFHPLSWLFALLPTGVAINWLIALSFLLTGLFFYGYLRSLPLGAAASFGGAVIWSFSNVLISRVYAGHLTILLELIEMPLILLLWERYRATRRLVFLAGLALAYGAMILAAYPQVLYIFSLFFMVYVLIQAAQAARTRAALLAEGRAILLLGLFILLGIGLGLVQLLPSADFASQSFRQRATIEFCGVCSFPPENFLTLLAPRFFGYAPTAGPGQYWGRDFYWEMCLYIGMLPLILALPGVLAAPLRRRVPLLACAGIFFVLGLGRFSPLFPLVYKYIPFFNVFRGPSKNMLIAELCLVTFSAYGLEDLFVSRDTPAGRKRLKVAFTIGAVLLGLVLLAYVYFIPGSAARESHWRRLLGWHVEGGGDVLAAGYVQMTVRFAVRELLRSALFIVLALGLLVLAWRGLWRRALLPLVLVLILADLLCVFLPLRVTYQESITRCMEDLAPALPSTPYPPRLIAEPFVPNAALHYGFSNPSGYVGNTLLRFNTFVNFCFGLPPETMQELNPITSYGPPLRFMAFDALILPEPMLRGNMEVLARHLDLALVRTPDPFPRAYLAAAPRLFPSSYEARRYVQTPTSDLLASPAAELPETAVTPAPLGAEETVRITAFSPNRVELEAHAAQPRLLVLAEMYERNWTATVNGQPAAVFPANYLFRGVELPAGNSRIVFAYRPAAFRHGACCSLLALAGLLGLGLHAGLKRKPLAPQGAPLPQEVPAPRNPPAPALAARKSKTSAKRSKR